MPTNPYGSLFGSNLTTGATTPSSTNPWSNISFGNYNPTPVLQSPPIGGAAGPAWMPGSFNPGNTIPPSNVGSSGGGGSVGSFLSSPGGAATIAGGLGLLGGILSGKSQSDINDKQLALQQAKLEQDQKLANAQMMLALINAANTPGNTAVRRDILANASNIVPPAGLESYTPTGGARIPAGGFSQETLSYFNPQQQAADMAKLKSYYEAQMASPARATTGANTATLGALTPAAAAPKSSSKSSWLGPVLGTVASIFGPSIAKKF